MGDPPPDWVDQLIGFCTTFRPPVYSTPEVLGNADTTLVREVATDPGGGGVLILLRKVQ